ncbi:MAG: glycosyltransferase [Clostridia bacterium]|nr:glycosyltransferase [Clostridia bacterium]
MDDGKPLVTVAVAVYNTAEWLPECLDGIKAQTFKDLEVILVDDGSTDGSGEICDGFASDAGNVRVIHQANRGLSVARDAAVTAAAGEYILFVDSDDYFDPETVEIMISAARGHGADVVCAGYSYTYSDHEERAVQYFPQDVCLDRYHAMEALVSGRLPGFAWGKLVRTSIAKKQRFPEGRVCQDLFWIHHVIDGASAVAVLNAAPFHYRQRLSSVSYTCNMKRLDIIDGWRARCEFIRERYPDLTDCCLEYLSTQFPGQCWLFLTRLKGSKKEAFARMRAFSGDYRLADHASGKDRKLIRALDRSAAAYAFSALCGKVRLF